jgi:hypothetical protein
MRSDPDLMAGTFIDECMLRLGAQETLARCHYKNKARVAIFREENNSAEHGTDGNFDLFRWKSVCFKEWKTL